MDITEKKNIVSQRLRNVLQSIKGQAILPILEREDLKMKKCLVTRYILTKIEETEFHS